MIPTHKKQLNKLWKRHRRLRNHFKKLVSDLPPLLDKEYLAQLHTDIAKLAKLVLLLHGERKPGANKDVGSRSAKEVSRTAE